MFPKNYKILPTLLFSHIKKFPQFLHRYKRLKRQKKIQILIHLYPSTTSMLPSLTHALNPLSLSPSTWLLSPNRHHQSGQPRRRCPWSCLSSRPTHTSSDQVWNLSSYKHSGMSSPSQVSITFEARHRIVNSKSMLGCVGPQTLLLL